MNKNTKYYFHFQNWEMHFENQKMMLMALDQLTEVARGQDRDYGMAGEFVYKWDEEVWDTDAQDA
jgi:hypothetical protein